MKRILLKFIFNEKDLLRKNDKWNFFLMKNALFYEKLKEGSSSIQNRKPFSCFHLSQSYSLENFASRISRYFRSSPIRQLQRENPLCWEALAKRCGQKQSIASFIRYAAVSLSKLASSEMKRSLSPQLWGNFYEPRAIGYRKSPESKMAIENPPCRSTLVKKPIMAVEFENYADEKIFDFFSLMSSASGIHCNPWSWRQEK